LTPPTPFVAIARILRSPCRKCAKTPIRHNANYSTNPGQLGPTGKATPPAAVSRVGTIDARAAFEPESIGIASPNLGTKSAGLSLW
jgi:hypothetical protein